MTAYRRAAPGTRPHAGAWAWATDVRLAGTLLFAAGVVILMGIITAEALYPLVYTTSGNEISDLGGTRPPEGLVFQPSATIFNISMMLTGLLVVAGAVLAHATLHRWSVTASQLVLGLAVFGVGVFPGNTGAPHALLAMVAFISGGVAAVMSARVVDGAFRWALAALGVVNLVALGTYFLLGDSNPLWALGVGGAERWVAYPVILWLLGYGGYVAGRGTIAETSRDG